VGGEDEDEDIPAMGGGDGQYVYVRTAEVERPVAMMAISTFEVRVCRGMRLHRTLYYSLMFETSHTGGRTYDSRIGVPGPTAEVRCRRIYYMEIQNEVMLMLYV
jgi:hypothetical protein